MYFISFTADSCRFRIRGLRVRIKREDIGQYVSSKDFFISRVPNCGLDCRPRNEYSIATCISVVRRASVDVTGVEANDVVRADESIRKLAQLTFDTVVFGHGDPVEGLASEQVAALAASL